MAPISASPHRVVRQSPGGPGHFLQPSWTNAGAFNRRIQELVPLVAGKTVLDVGCTSALGRPDWIHAGIAGVAERTVGVDIDEAAVEQARSLGFDVRVADAETLALDEQFDVVHAGELIEHLDNPRAFLGACHRRLHVGGRLILTTPNPFAVSNFVYRIGGTPRVNGDHTCWYCEDTLRQLLERNRFEVEEVRYLRHDTPGRWRQAIVHLVRRCLPVRLAWNTLLVVARPTPEGDAS